MSDKRFYVCQHCGNLVGMIHDAGVPLVCCGEKMKMLEANTVDASVEKHTPVVKVEGKEVSVSVGSAEHPMTEEHLIQWIYLLTSEGGHRKNLSHSTNPEVKFALTENEKPLAVFAYCNLHGLWKTDI